MGLPCLSYQGQVGFLPGLSIGELIVCPPEISRVVPVRGFSVMVYFKSSGFSSEVSLGCIPIIVLLAAGTAACPTICRLITKNPI